MDTDTPLRRFLDLPTRSHVPEQDAAQNPSEALATPQQERIRACLIDALLPGANKYTERSNSY